ncbi:MAG: hypothetical protein J0H74_18570 [Chitinophagaceae bacterium]|nr:hypothetical protein [Chitinophagaceae bacterium]
MKRIKIASMALLAIVTGASAFTTKSDSKRVASITYYSIQTVAVGGHNYFQVVTVNDIHSPTCGTGVNHACNVLTNGTTTRTAGGKILTTGVIIISKRL